MRKLSATVRSLLASSLGLPGMQDLLAQEAPEDGIDYRYTHYDEDPLPQGQLAEGDPSRYSIDTHQLRWVKNLDDTYTLSVDYMHEAMSGSSPWYVMPNEGAQDLQVMSGATIREKRDQVDVALARRAGGYTHTGALGYSIEDDYEAIYGSYAGEKASENGLSTISWGLSYSDDELDPTDAFEFSRIESASRDAFSASTGFTQVLNRNAVLQTGVALTRQSGYLSDPYKLVWVGDTVLNDSRPDERVMWAWTTRLRQFIDPASAAVHLDYRYFRDDWGIGSHTIDLGWHQKVGAEIEITPSVRYYSQTSADFYGPVFAGQPADGFGSSDYRLATYGALGYRLNGVLRKEKWSLSIGAEYYDSDTSLAMSGTPEDAPGLVDFWRITAGISVEL